MMPTRYLPWIFYIGQGCSQITFEVRGIWVWPVEPDAQSSYTAPMSPRCNPNFCAAQFPKPPDANFLQQLSHLHHQPNYFSMSMQLAPSAEVCYEHTSLDSLTNQINEHARNEGYALTRKRSKSSKLEILLKVVLRCDRGDRWLDKGLGHRLIKSKRNECSFECLAKLDGKEEDPEIGLGNWILIVKRFDHEKSVLLP